MKLRSLLVVLLSCCALLGIVLLSGCQDAAPAKLAQATPIATVPYLPPTVVPPYTPVPTKTPKATATSHPRPAGTPLPTPTPAPVPPGPLPNTSVPNIGGQLILVSLSQQWMWAYQDHRLVYRSAVTSGMPQLPTPDGTFHVRWHEQNIMFYSPWPPGSPYYYSPVHVNYAMYFLDYGFYIHDAPWRQVFGPGTNYPHTDPNGQTVTGSHGCVELPTGAMYWVYRWARDGATIVIYGTAPNHPPPTPTPAPIKPTPTPTKPPAPTATPTSMPTPEPTATPTA